LRAVARFILAKIALKASQPNGESHEAALLHASGRLAEAVNAYHDVLNARPARHFSSIVRGIQGYLTRHILAILYEDAGQLAKAEEQWRLVCREAPGYRLAGVGWKRIWRGKGSVAESLCTWCGEAN
jgi:hypothetical protein